MEIVNISVIGIFSILLATQFKVNRQEYGIYITLAACFLIFFYTVTKLHVIMDTIAAIQQYISINKSYISALAKIVGVTYISEFASDVCKDGGHASVANQIQIFGKLAIMGISMPVILALLESIDTLLR